MTENTPQYTWVKKRIFLTKKVSEKLREPQHLKGNGCKIQLEEAYQSQCLILEYDSEISQDDELRLRFINWLLAQGEGREREEGQGADMTRCSKPGNRDK